MKTTTIELPSLYGDHHVLEVRKILLDLPGVDDVYASSAFHLVEITYDPAKIDESKIKEKLEEAGYFETWEFPTETGQAAIELEQSSIFFRHTEVFETSRQTVAFQQKVQNIGRPLWNCPGFGVIKNKMED